MLITCIVVYNAFINEYATKNTHYLTDAYM